MKHLNEKQTKKVKEYYKSLSKQEKLDFFIDINERGIFVHIPPLWEDVPLFDRLLLLYKEFEWLKPQSVYVNRFGRKIKMMNDKMIVGEMYVIKLKQTSKKGFSARSTGSVNKRGLPEKSVKAKIHQELYPRTPIRMGEQENINSMIGVEPEITARLNLFYRTSILGRRQLGSELATSLKEIKKFRQTKNFTNINAEIFLALAKTLGLGLEFDEVKTKINIYSDTVKQFAIGKRMVLCTQREYEQKRRKYEVETDLRENKCFVGTKGEYQKKIEELVEEKRKDETMLRIKINIGRADE